MSNKNEVEGVISDALSWIAAESKYFNEVKKDFARLKEFINYAKQQEEKRGIKILFRDIRYLGKAERRFQRYEARVEEFAQKLYERVLRGELVQSAEEIADLKERLHIEATQLLVDFSLYEGKINGLLRHLQLALTLKDIGQAHQCLMEIEQALQEAEKWIAAAAEDLTQAKKLVVEFQEVYYGGIEGIEAVMEHLTPIQQLQYILNLVLKKKTLFPGNLDLKQVVPLARNAVEKEGTESACQVFLEICSKLGCLKEAGEVFLGKGYWKRAVMCFETIGDYEKAGEAYLLAAANDKHKEVIGFYREGLLVDQQSGEPFLVGTYYKEAVQFFSKAKKEDKVREAYKTWADAALHYSNLDYKEKNRQAHYRIYNSYRGRPEEWAIRAEPKKVLESWEMKGYLSRYADKEKALVAELYEKAGEADKAKKLYEEAAYLSLRPSIDGKNLNSAKGFLASAGYSPQESAIWIGKKLCSVIEDWKTRPVRDLDHVRMRCYYIGRMYEDVGMWEEAVKIYHTVARDPEKAAKIYKEQGKPREAAEVYEEFKKWKDAAGIYEELEMWKKAAECWRKAGLPDKALTAARKAGEITFPREEKSEEKEKKLERRHQLREVLRRHYTT